MGRVEPGMDLEPATIVDRLGERGKLIRKKPGRLLANWRGWIAVLCRFSDRQAAEGNSRARSRRRLGRAAISPCVGRGIATSHARIARSRRRTREVFGAWIFRSDISHPSRRHPGSFYADETEDPGLTSRWGRCLEMGGNDYLVLVSGFWEARELLHRQRERAGGASGKH